MRIKFGRPDLGRYTDLFDVPPATGDFAVTFLGVATLLLDDGECAVMTDGFFSRPPLLKVGLGRISPDRTRINAALTRAGVDGLAAVLPVHSHYDHALDAAIVADRTGAELVGGESTAFIGHGHGLAANRIHVVTTGETRRYGNFEITHIASEHCPPDRYPGVITAPVVPPVRTSVYRCGEAWSILAAHDSGRTALVQGSAGFVTNALAGRRADVAYLGVGQLGVQGEEYIRSYWRETVQTVGAQRVVLTHWDDFFRPLSKPLRALPYAGDDLDRTIRILGELAATDGVILQMPSLWQRQDPWVGVQPQF